MVEELVRENRYEVVESTSLVEFLLGSCAFLHSREEVFSLCAEDRLLLNGSLVRADCPLKMGDEVVLLTPQSLEPAVDEDISLLYEDDYFFAVDKPAQLPIHPSGKYFFNTLTSLLERKLHLPAQFPYNRIDRETSGIVLFAKKAEYISLLQKIDIDKGYYALVFGVVEPSGIIDKPLLQKTVGVLRHHVVVDEDGKQAVTEFRRLGYSDRCSLVEVKLVTGRKHQIRVHFASLGHPLVGDKQYGSHPELLLSYATRPKSLLKEELIKKVGATRQMLHCYKVEFIHPITGDLISILSKIREDFLYLLNEERIELITPQ